MAIEPVAATVLVGEDMTSPRRLEVPTGEVAWFSSAAPHRPGANEDSAALATTGDGDCLLMVADGAGGQPNGADASRLAIEKIVQHVSEQPDPLRAAILDGFDAAQAELRATLPGSGTTLVVAWIAQGVLRVFHVGDSMVLVTGQRGRIKHQTFAHAPVAYAVESGLLDEADAIHHAERHLVSNLVGDVTMHIELGALVTLAQRDTVVIGSDGLFDNLHTEEISAVVRTGDLLAAAGRLAQACQRRMTTPAEGDPSKPDDLTFLLFRPGRLSRDAP